MISPRLRALVRVSAALASRVPEQLDEAFDEALGRVSPEDMEEALLQSYLFVGYPVALGALSRWRAKSGEPPPEEASGESWEVWRRRGEAVCRGVYGSQYEALRRNVRRLHPDLDRWMVTEGYGKVLGRPGLSLVERELLIIALLAALRTPTQLYSHLRGALAVGAEPATVEQVLEVAGRVLDAEGRAEAAGIWTRVRERRKRRSAEEASDG